jgi:O-succinylbenzoic acid--CoA ligase
LLHLCGAEWHWVPTAAGQGRLQRTGVPEASCDTHLSDLALVVETSGSSGRPKAVMLTARNLLASAIAVNRRLALGPDDCWLSCVPRCHIGGLSVAYRCALAGAALLLHEHFDPEAVYTDLERYAATHLSLVPPMLARLLDVGAAAPDTLRVCLVGGQALTAGLAARALAVGWPLHVTYGMTETASQVTSTGRLRAVPAPGDVGDVLPGITVTAPPCGAPPLPIAVKGDVVMAGYANPTRTAGIGLEAGWFRTADLGCLSDTGKLAILGRADDALVIAGHTVFPAHVEGQLARVTGLSGVVVLGIPDETWGYRLAAVYSGEVEPAVLERWCREHLPSHERPRDFRRLDRLPLSPSGKHDRMAVRATLAAGSPSEESDGAP